MKSFKEFLFESAAPYKEVPSEYNDTEVNQNFKHVASIGGHRIGIDHVFETLRGRKTLYSSFTVNNTYDKEKAPSVRNDHSVSIFHTAFKSIGHMIEKHRPNELRFYAANPVHEEGYKALASGIAARFNGKVMPKDEKYHVVKFD